MNPTTWIFLRSAGRHFSSHQTPTEAAVSNLRTEVAAAISEGYSLQQIADAALLPLTTIRIHQPA